MDANINKAPNILDLNQDRLLRFVHNPAKAACYKYVVTGSIDSLPVVDQMHK